LVPFDMTFNIPSRLLGFSNSTAAKFAIFFKNLWK